MRSLRRGRQSVAALCASVFAAGVFLHAQAPAPPFQPEVGQEGKDVVWVPTPEVTVDTMLDIAKVTAHDYVIDLGSGDGVIVITAAKRGARALGIEYDPDLVELSKRNAAAEGLGDRANFAQGDLFESDLSQATVITMFLGQDLNLRLRPRILDLKPGTRIVSNTFHMEEWEADETEVIRHGCRRWCTALLWIVPANVEGTWTLPQGALTLRQDFQMISGALVSGGTTRPLEGGRVRGDEISFFVGGADYTGRVTGDTMEGTLSSGKSTSRWSATRAL